jgi:hypothetical protein
LGRIAARHLLFIAGMARIRTMKRPSSTVVVIAGRLRAGDMRRLEHACSPALTSADPDLTVDIRRVTGVDAAAETVLQRFAARGARIRQIE